MDINLLARMSGVNVKSVLEHTQVSSTTHILRVDLKNEPELRRAIEAGSSGKRQLPDGDRFETSALFEGKPHPFVAKWMDKTRSYNFGDESGVLPAWILGAETYSPESLFSVLVERINFTVFDRHSGAVHDLSTPNDHWQRPWLGLELGILNIVGEVNLISTLATSGFIEINHDFDGENSMHLAGAFSNVRFNVENLNQWIPTAPNAEFTVELTGGFYALSGKW
ncbi:hypothetical protein ACIP1T_00940 [Pseudomonas japonica]|uniref:hypothetical protein n=1 Tax=Pseudomonas japonica TaxID=256466 RepID=UPI0037F74C11